MYLLYMQMLGGARDMLKKGTHSFSLQLTLQHQCWHVQPLLKWGLPLHCARRPGQC